MHLFVFISDRLLFRSTNFSVMEASAHYIDGNFDENSLLVCVITQ